MDQRGQKKKLGEALGGGVVGVLVREDAIGLDGGRQEGEQETDLTHGLEQDLVPDCA